MTTDEAFEVCCCGHARIEHRSYLLDPSGSCKTCGGIYCAKFHAVARRRSRLVIAAIVVVLIGAWLGIVYALS